MNNNKNPTHFLEILDSIENIKWCKTNPVKSFYKKKWKIAKTRNEFKSNQVKLKQFLQLSGLNKFYSNSTSLIWFSNSQIGRILKKVAEIFYEKTFFRVFI